MIPEISAEELASYGLVGWWLILVLLLVGALVSGLLTGAIKSAVVGSYLRAGRAEPGWCHAVWTLLPFLLGAVVVLLGALVVGLQPFWGATVGLIAGGSSSGAVYWYKRLTRKAGETLEDRLAAQPVPEEQDAQDTDTPPSSNGDF